MSPFLGAIPLCAELALLTPKAAFESAPLFSAEQSPSAEQAHYGSTEIMRWQAVAVSPRSDPKQSSGGED